MKWDKLDMAYSEKPSGIQRLSDLDILFGSKTEQSGMDVIIYIPLVTLCSQSM